VCVCGDWQSQSTRHQNWNVHQLLQRLKNVDVLDGVSQNSAEDGSNTDSGRGPSEPDAVVAGGGVTAEHGSNARQCPASLQTDAVGTGRIAANHYGQSVATPREYDNTVQWLFCCAEYEKLLQLFRVALYVGTQNEHVVCGSRADFGRKKCYLRISHTIGLRCVPIKKHPLALFI